MKHWYTAILIFHPSHLIFRTTQPFLQTIMKDRWINTGYEDSELKPYKEPSKDELDPIRIGNFCVKFMFIEIINQHYLPYLNLGKTVIRIMFFFSPFEG